MQFPMVNLLRMWVNSVEKQFQLKWSDDSFRECLSMSGAHFPGEE